MTEPSVVSLLNGPDIALHDAFCKAESAADLTRPLADEMMEAVAHERDRLGASLRLANHVYGAPLNPVEMRRYVVLRYAIDLIERVAAHKAKVAPILYPELTRKPRSAA